MKTKQMHMTGFKVLSEDQGEVEAVFAELEVKDHHGDVTMKGAFKKEDVRISAYNHGSWGSALPVGKGTIEEKGGKAIFKGKFFMDTQAGQETFIVVKELEDLGEWSYGYDTLEEERGEFKGERVNIIKKQKVHEVSPVLLGAGIGTSTIGTKSRNLGKAMKQLYSDIYEDLREEGCEHFNAGNGRFVSIQDFDIDDNFVIYRIWEEGEEVRYVQMDYTRNEEGEIEIGNEETEVEIEASYVPVKSGGIDHQTKDLARHPETGEELEPKRKDKTDRPGLKFVDHIKAVLTDLDELNERAAAVVTLRTEQGKKAMGDEAASLLAEVETRMENLKGLLQKQDDGELDALARVELDEIARSLENHE